jgi:hypothetical protein
LAQQTIKATVSGKQEIASNILLLKALVPAALAEANQLTAEEMLTFAQDNLRNSDTIVTGDLYNSLRTRVGNKGLQVALGSVSPYAPFVEYGTRPHFPPPDAIRAWCRMRGIPESAVYPICLKIAKHGTPAQPFLWPAYRLGQQRHLQRAAVLLIEALKTVSAQARRTALKGLGR